MVVVSGFTLLLQDHECRGNRRQGCVLAEASDYIAEMPWRRFVAFTTVGAVLWVALWAPLGYLAGNHIGTIYADMIRYSLYLLIALGVLVAAWIARTVLRRRRRAAQQPGQAPELKNADPGAGQAAGPGQAKKG